MVLSRLFLIVIAIVAVSFPPCLIAAAPLPPNGAFPYPGFPKYIESGWAQTNTTMIEGQVSLFYNGQAIAQILADDGTLSTKMMNITSYQCLDNSTYRYMASEVIYPNKTAATVCVTEFANTTHRFSAVMPSGQELQGCPDSPFLAGGGSDQTHFVYLRQDGVLPAPSETSCMNQSNPYIPPLVRIPPKNQSKPTVSDMPYDKTYGAPVGSGVWKSKDLIVLENRFFYAAAMISPETATSTSNSTTKGNLFAVVGIFFSHDCMTTTEFVSTSMVTRIFNNGTIDYGTACQNGTRDNSTSNSINNGIGDILRVDYSQGPNCTIYSAPEPTDALTTRKFALEFVQPLNSNPNTQCSVLDSLATAPPSPPETNGSGRRRLFMGLGGVNVAVVTMVLSSLVAVSVW